MLLFYFHSERSEGKPCNLEILLAEGDSDNCAAEEHTENEVVNCHRHTGENDPKNVGSSAHRSAVVDNFFSERGKSRLKSFEPNAPEEFVFPHIAALFGTLTSVWFRQRSTTLHEKTSPSGAKQFLKSKFLSRQGKKLSNADALRGFLTQYRRKFALKNRIGFKALQPKLCKLEALFSERYSDDGYAPEKPHKQPKQGVECTAEDYP